MDGDFRGRRAGSSIVRGILRGRGDWSWVGIAWLAFGSLTLRAASDDPPVLLSIFPPGVTIGSDAVWTLGGRNLAGVERFRIGGDGIAVVRRKSLGDEVIELTVRAAASAEPGFREVYVQGPGGFSNPRVVRVDPLPQVEETEPNDDPAHATPLRIGSAANGRLGPMDVDCFVF